MLRRRVEFCCISTARHSFSKQSHRILSGINSSTLLLQLVLKEIPCNCFGEMQLAMESNRTHRSFLQQSTSSSERRPLEQVAAKPLNKSTPIYRLWSWAKKHLTNKQPRSVCEKGAVFQAGLWKTGLDRVINTLSDGKNTMKKAQKGPFSGSPGPPREIQKGVQKTSFLALGSLLNMARAPKTRF